MSVLVSHLEPWTAQDVLPLYDLPDVPDHTRFEAVDGILLVTPPPPRRHQWVADELLVALKQAVPDSLKVFSAIGVRFGQDYVIPDLVVMDAEASLAAENEAWAASVVLIVEVESPTGRSRDRLLKPDAYARAGIAHYWRVERDDPARPVVVVGELRDGVYEVTARIEVGTPTAVPRPFPVTIDAASLVLGS